MKKIDMVGQIYGRLTILDDTYRKNGRVLCLCKCDCGTIKKITSEHLRRSSGRVFSCGCLQKEIITNIGRSKKTHGKSRTKIYTTWRNMLSRCNNKKDPYFYLYGERGIKVCKEWMNFKNFYRDMGIKPENKSIDRIDNNLGYFAENCKWSTPKQQAQNRRKK